jgi:hypothetical protein
MIDNLKAKEDFEKNNNVRILQKDKSWAMKFVNFFFMLCGNHNFMTDFWTTYRLPFQKATITYPDKLDMLRDLPILEHEMFHVRQMRPWYGLVKSGLLVALLPLPFIFSGRWFIERDPYLNDIAKSRYTIDEAVDILWYYYGWAWPKSLMKKWFTKKLAK